jgi:hypothetical protein
MFLSTPNQPSVNVQWIYRVPQKSPKTIYKIFPLKKKKTFAETLNPNVFSKKDQSHNF